MATRTAAAGALAAGLIVGLSASPAAAATGRSDVCDTYLCGSGTFTWGTHKLKGAMSIKDNECNGKGVAIAILVYHFDGIAERGALRWTPYNCHQGYYLWPNLEWNDSKKIKGFRVVGKQEGEDYYHAGSYVDNPLT
ncbi:hypothetical protein [Streptomyces sp. BA2]|uniref:hypothetical protein n=1 Tax=Streptomyces sp. BA2 TaxID=436595 RepID=UPI00132B40DA|nr:hypothetical protein [Streptomyces sp. BA2]MWA08402.1 hypothetical protein [Streptomyces sp. BA2]